MIFLNHIGIADSKEINPYGDEVDGSKPSKFRHKHKRLFVDRNEARSVFGQKPGKYHGYMIDQKLGGTYNVNKGIDIIENLKKYSKFRKFISEMHPK